MATNYHNEFSKFRNICANAEKKNIENHIDHYKTIEEMIGFQYWLYDKITTLYNSKEDYVMKHIPDVLIHGLFYHNFLSLYAAFLTAQQNLLHQTVSNLRTVYESIPKMYYASFYPNEMKYMVLKDHMEGRNDTKAMTYLRSKNAELIFEPTELMNPAHLIEYVKDKYYFKWFNSKIYTEEQIEKSKSAYGLLSISSHGSLLRHQVGEVSKEDTGDLFEFIELLSFFNVAAELNGHKTMIEEDMIPAAEIVGFLEKMRTMLVKDGKMGSLFPDHPDVAKKVWIHPPGTPWD